jgi:hypothetical protein
VGYPKMVIGAGSPLARGFIIATMNPFITFTAQSRPSLSRPAQLDQARSPVLNRADAVRRSAHAAPTPAGQWRCGIRLATGDRRPRRRRGRPLYPRSAHGRPLTADDGARNREYVIDDGTRRGGERPTRHQPPGRWRSFRFVTNRRNTTKHLPAGFMTHS